MSHQGGPILADNYLEIFNPDEIGIDNLRSSASKMEISILSS